MASFVSPKCPACGAAVATPRLVKMPVKANGSRWMAEATPFAVGFQCANDDCGSLLPLAAYPPADEDIPIYGG